MDRLYYMKKCYVSSVYHTLFTNQNAWYWESSTSFVSQSLELDDTNLELVMVMVLFWTFNLNLKLANSVVLRLLAYKISAQKKIVTHTRTSAFE